jgi:alpha-D-ribose 1-methylphosphonate 5-phosphate C-P lyase
MADQKISELINITGANLANADEFVVVDTSADQTKAVTRAEFFKNTPSIDVTE